MELLNLWTPSEFLFIAVSPKGVIMPLYEYECHCGKCVEVLNTYEGVSPVCQNCGSEMDRIISAPARIKILNKAGWINRINEIHKRQADKGERLRLPHPKEVRAS